MKAKAIVLGGSGLVGSQLVKLLLNDDRVSSILLIGRSSFNITNTKLSELIVDFDKPEDWAPLVQGDILFSAFGTTIKKAGSKENQYKIDYKYQWEVANAAAKNGVKSCVLISSLGAKATSSIFYSRIKGELDRDVKTLPFDNVIILKPSLLMGERKEHRAGEKMGAIIGKVFRYLPMLKKYRPIQDSEVAQAMINCAFECKGKVEFVANELFEKAKY
jgi:uncharacterized protein YbjT (DUF2867 family)